MPEYTYADFLATLGDMERRVAEAIHVHITGCCSEYKPFNIRPTNSTLQIWSLNYRKKPEFGKALCSLYSFVVIGLSPCPA